MEFLHAAFLAGTATFAVPLVIHLIFRMKKRRIVFSSVRFLQQTVLKETRKLRLREWLLLLLRCLACILLALAFARPFRPTAAMAGSSGKPLEDVVLVLDDSPSLLAQEGVSLRWQQQLERARTLVNNLRPGDRAGLVLGSDPARAEIELSSNFGAISAALQKDKPSARRGDLSTALNTAVELVATSTQPGRRVVLFTDLQFNQIDRGAWADVAQKAAAGRGVTIAIETPNGSQPARLPNLAINDVRPKSDVWIEGRPIALAIRVANYGETEATGVTVRLMMDGKALASKTIGLGPKSTTEIELSAPFPRPGETFGSVELESHDVLPEDDKRLFALRLRDSVKVLIVEDQLREKDTFLDEGYYIRMALDPKARGTDAPALAGSYVQITSVESRNFTPDRMRGADVVMLIGVNSLAEPALKALEDSVRDGRNLIVFAGRSDGRLAETFYNGPLWKGGEGLLPAKLGGTFTGSVLEGRYHKLGPFVSDHPIFKPFDGENETYLRMPRYYRHYTPDPADLAITTPGPEKEPAAPKETPTAGDTPKPVTRPAGKVVAQFEDGTPMIVERAFGKGNVLLFSFAPRPEASTLPTRKVFVPLLHQTVRYLARVESAARRNLVVGDSFDFADIGVTPEDDVSLEKPGAKKEILNLTGKDHPSAEIAGIYIATVQKETIKEQSLWAVNTDARESDLMTEDLASIRGLFASNPKDAAGLADSLRQFQLDEEQKRLAPDWRYFLVAALGCLLLEVWLRDLWA